MRSRIWTKGALIAALSWCSGVACGDDAQCLPSDVDDVLQDKCRLCHNDALEFGAPMSLQSYSDTQAHAPLTPKRLVWQEIARRIHLRSSPMPPAGLPVLTVAELEVLDRWVAGGAGPCGL